MRVSWIAVACLLAATPAAAQQRPLVTEDPEVIGAGLVLLEGGFDYSRDVLFPASGLQGNLLRAPTLGVSFGISSIAELQIARKAVASAYEAACLRLDGPSWKKSAKS